MYVLAFCFILSFRGFHVILVILEVLKGHFCQLRSFNGNLVIIKVLRGICIFGGLECILVILDILESIFVMLRFCWVFFLKRFSMEFWFFFFKFFFKYFSPFEGLNIVLEVLKVLGSFWIFLQYFFLGLCSFEFENGWKCFMP